MQSWTGRRVTCDAKNRQLVIGSPHAVALRPPLSSAAMTHCLLLPHIFLTSSRPSLMVYVLRTAGIPPPRHVKNTKLRPPTQTIDFVRARLKDSGDEPPLSKTCADLCDACCAETADGDGTGLDNVTAVIVQLNTEGARALMHGGSGDMDTSDDGKRKQGGDEDGRTSRKQMKAAQEEAAAAAAAAVAEGADGDT